MQQSRGNVEVNYCSRVSVGVLNVTLNHIIFHCLALVAMLHDINRSIE